MSDRSHFNWDTVDFTEIFRSVKLKRRRDNIDYPTRKIWPTTRNQFWTIKCLQYSAIKMRDSLFLIMINDVNKYLLLIISEAIFNILYTTHHSVNYHQ